MRVASRASLLLQPEREHFAVIGGGEHHAVRQGEFAVMVPRGDRVLQGEDGSRGRRQHVVQRPGRADRVHARRGLPVLREDRHGPPLSRGLLARQARPARAAEGRVLDAGVRARLRTTP